MPGVNVFMQAGQDINVGGRLSKTEYQYTLQVDRQRRAQPLGADHRRRMAKLPELQDVTPTSRSPRRTSAIDDRPRHAPRGSACRSPQIDRQTLYDAFGQRQVATIYTSSNQYKVVLEVLPRVPGRPGGASRIYVTRRERRAGAARRLRKFTNDDRAAHRQPPGPVPGGDHSFNLAPGMALGEAVDAIQQVQARAARLPTLDAARFQGTAQAFQDSLSSDAAC